MTHLDRELFERLVRDHHADVFRSALRVLREPAAAEDVVQDVFLRALTGKLALASAASPRALLCWLATRLAQNARRSRRQREHTVRPQTDQEEAAVMSEEPTPVAVAQQIERQRRLRALVNDLPADLRLPLLLRFEDELTFAAIGSALQLSESAAHDRVQRALDRLRARLSDSGWALSAVALPRELPGVLAKTAQVPVPAGLQTRLLGLWRAAGAGLAIAKIAVVALLLTGMTIAAVAIGGGSGGSPPETASVARSDRLAGNESDGARTPDGGDGVAGARARVPVQAAPPAPVSPQDPVSDHATYQGSVQDATRAPVEGARVVAVAAGGYKPFELVATTTDAAGAFTLAVPRAAEPVPATKIRIRVLDGSLQVYRSDELALPAGDEPVAMPIVLSPDAGLQSDRYELQVTVRGAAGAPVADARVVLYPAGSADAGGPEPSPGASGGSENEARTDARGIALLGGRVPGSKLLFVDGRPLGLRAELAEISVDAGGRHPCRIDLDAGRELSARINTVDGVEPRWVNAWLEDETTRVAHRANVQADGTVRFEHLGDGPFTLRVWANPFSPARLTGLRAGRQPVVVQLKRQDDERPVGDHEAELHGRLVDAATGETVGFVEFCVEVCTVPTGASTLPLDRADPAPPVQRMIADGGPKLLERFHLTGLCAGEHAVVVDVPGYGRSVEVVTVADNELRTDLAIELHRPAIVEGQVVAGDGTPLADVLVFVAGFGAGADLRIATVDEAVQGGERSNWEWHPPCSARTDQSGRFELRRVPPMRRLRVVAVAQGRRPAESSGTVLQAGETRDGLEIRCR